MLPVYFQMGEEISAMQPPEKLVGDKGMFGYNKVMASSPQQALQIVIDAMKNNKLKTKPRGFADNGDRSYMLSPSQINPTLESVEIVDYPQKSYLVKIPKVGMGSYQSMAQTLASIPPGSYRGGKRKRTKNRRNKKRKTRRHKTRRH